VCGRTFGETCWNPTAGGAMGLDLEGEREEVKMR
jgi:hypothetical protein